MKDFKALLREAKLPEETVPICLRGDLVAEFERLERDLEEAQKRTVDSLAGNGARPIAQRMEEIREQMAESTVTFRLRALASEAWYDLTEAHPPRVDGDGVVLKRDRLGVNTETFFPALLRKCVIEPALDDEDWAALPTALTAKQRRNLNTAAWNLNQEDVDIPFSYDASQILDSEPESRRPSDSASPSDDLRDGSTPPDTSTTETD